MAETRAASEDALFEQARSRLARLLEEGVTTVEIKSGYGLELDTELRMLRVARRLEEALPVTVRTTFLGAHALPEEFKELGADAYIDHVCHDILPKVAMLPFGVSWYTFSFNSRAFLWLWSLSLHDFFLLF